MNMFKSKKKKQVAVYFFEDDIEIIKEAIGKVNEANTECGYLKVNFSSFISENTLNYAKDIVKNGY